MHHGRDDQMRREVSRKIMERLKESQDKIEEETREVELGPTGNFPGGQLTPHDEGEIMIGVTVKDGKVILAFGGPVTWIGFSPQQARELAEALRKRSHEIK